MNCGLKRDTRIRRIITIASIAMAAFCVAMICATSLNSNRYIEDTALNGFSQMAEETSMQTVTYLEDKNRNLQTVANLIDSLDLATDDFSKLLVTTEELTGEFVLVDPKTYVGHTQGENVSDASGDAIWQTGTIDYSDTQSIKDACEKALENSKEEGKIEIELNTANVNADSADAEEYEMAAADIVPDRIAVSIYNVTDTFKEPGRDHYSVALYKCVQVKGQDMVLFYILNLDNLAEEVLSKSADQMDNYLLDQSGNILYCDNEEVAVTAENFTEYIEENYMIKTDSLMSKLGRYESKDLSEFYTTDTGSLVCRSNDNENKVFIYNSIYITDETRWIYVQGVSTESLKGLMAGASKLRNYLQGICMVSPLLFILIIVLRLNRSLILRRREMECMNADLIRANEAQNVFISNMSHEIRTPINAVLGMDEMILRESTEEDIINYAKDIKSAGNTLLGIVNDILDFTKIEAGKLDLIDTNYDIGSVVHDLSNLVKKRMDDKNLDFHVHLDESIPHVMYGDELRIKQIIMNILTNAAKYTEEGSVDFTVALAKESAAKKDSIQAGDSVKLYIEVRDTGIGMKAEEMDRLTKPFERLDEERNRTIEGTGLGLSIVTRLLQQMGSKLMVESTYGKGSIFHFELEQKVVDATPVGPLLERYATEENGAEKSVLHASKAKILAVDDTPVNLTVILGLLKRTAVQVDTAESGPECLRLAEENDYDVILLDHRMPGMDGVETLHRLREIDKVKDLPIIALTANVVSGAKEYYLEEGFTDFLSKPVNALKLERMLLKYLPEDKIDSSEEIATSIQESEAVKISGSEELYGQVCRDFLDGIDRDLDQMEVHWEAGDLENFTIKVHALKSSARLVGAMELSDFAKKMEEYGKEGNAEAISAEIGRLFEHTRTVASRLSEKWGQSDEDLPLITEEELQEILNATEEFLSIYDFDQIDFCINTLKGYQMPQEKKEAVKNLIAAVAAVDADRIAEILKELKNE